MGKKFISRIKRKIKNSSTNLGFSGNLEFIFKNFIFKKYLNNIHIQSTYETLDEIETCIQNQKAGAYFRFGDGDVFLMKFKNDSFQKADKNLSTEIMEAFSLNGTNIFKTLPIHSDFFGYDEGMFKGNHKNDDDFAKQLLLTTFPYFIGYKIYSPVALHFIASTKVQRANLFLKVLKNNTKVFIGNQNFTPVSIKLLFGDIPHIKTPSSNAYSEINRIYEETIDAIDNNSYGVICIAMGCAGRALMKRLYRYNPNNIFLFDFGSLLDGINGYESRTWLKLNKINYNDLTNNL